jgi:hypothetical protein
MCVVLASADPTTMREKIQSKKWFEESTPPSTHLSETIQSLQFLCSHIILFLSRVPSSLEQSSDWSTVRPFWTRTILGISPSHSFSFSFLFNTSSLRVLVSDTDGVSSLEIIKASSKIPEMKIAVLEEDFINVVHSLLSAFEEGDARRSVELFVQNVSQRHNPVGEINMLDSRLQ